MSTAEVEVSRPSLLSQVLEWRVFGEAYASLWSYPLLKKAPRGDGQPVLVLPGFMASEASTFVLRHFLKSMGYRAHTWKLGRNLGPIGEKEHDIHERLKELARRYKRKISIVGWSLGGVYARELAWLDTELVRQVITLGTPIRHPNSVTVSWLYEDVTGQREAHMSPELLARVPEPPPVPSSCIYSRSDGVVPWQCAIEKPSRYTENIRVEGSHLGMGFHPAVLWAVADRLAQPEGRWRKFKAPPCTGLLYPKPDIFVGKARLKSGGKNAGKTRN
jgi:hypothetical protein